MVLHLVHCSDKILKIELYIKANLKRMDFGKRIFELRFCVVFLKAVKDYRLFFNHVVFNDGGLPDRTGQVQQRNTAL
jgi:hypothetical protein